MRLRSAALSLLLIACGDGRSDSPEPGLPVSGTSTDAPLVPGTDGSAVDPQSTNPMGTGSGGEGSSAGTNAPADDPANGTEDPAGTPSPTGNAGNGGAGFSADPTAGMGGEDGEPPSPTGGASTGGAAGAGETDAAGGTGGEIPIIDGPPPPAITFDEYDIPEPSQPGWITTGPDGQIWFTHQSTAPSALTKVAPSGSPFVRYTTPVTNTGPRGIAPGPDGNIWYSKQGGIGRMNPSGMTTEFGVPNGGDSADITLGPDGNLWFTQQINNRISRVTPDAQFQSFDVPTPDAGPLAITTGADGNLWFTEAAAGGNRIGRITPDGQITEFPIATPASNPTGITQGPGDELWFAMHDVAKIGKISLDGEITEYYIPSRNRPGRIIAGPDGNLWFTLSAANAIGRITPLGQVSEYVIPTAASDPYDLTVGPDENLWFTELSTNKVGRISNLDGGGDVDASEGGAEGDELGGDTPCSKDTDCNESGRACGGDVCSAEQLCVLAVSGDPGSCSTDDDCWCQGQGAVCGDGHCSFITPGGAP